MSTLPGAQLQKAMESATIDLLQTVLAAIELRKPLLHRVVREAIVATLDQARAALNAGQYGEAMFYLGGALRQASGTPH